MRNKLCILEDQRLFRKFCQSLDRQIQCKRSHGTSADAPGQCVACPLALAGEVAWLMTYKGMTLGEAVKAVVRAPIAEDKRWEIFREFVAAVVDQVEPCLKDNEERAAAAVILGEAREDED